MTAKPTAGPKIQDQFPDAVFTNITPAPAHTLVSTIKDSIQAKWFWKKDMLKRMDVGHSRSKASSTETLPLL
jgi:hypothetical protein